MKTAKQTFPSRLLRPSLRGRRSKGNRKGIRARDHARGRRKEGNACKEATVFAIPPTNGKNDKNNATVNDMTSCQISLAVL